MTLPSVLTEARKLSTWALQSARFWPALIRNKPVVWLNPDNTVAEVEQWTRRDRMDLRPLYFGLLRTEKCGCSRRLGKRVLIAIDCREHGIPDLWDDEESA